MRVVHGHAKNKTPTYQSWVDMLQRCNNPRCATYNYYGGRGIKVCKRWRNFENFLADMGKKPEGKELDRRDNNGNYEPTNCRWITHRKNSNNRRSNVRITHGNRTLTLVQWARKLGISKQLINYRLRRGWRVSEVLSPKR